MSANTNKFNHHYLTQWEGHANKADMKAVIMLTADAQGSLGMYIVNEADPNVIILMLQQAIATIQHNQLRGIVPGVNG